MQTFFDRVGGEQTFQKLASEFYRGVSQDQLLSPMYPPDDLAGAERRLRMFLEQYWGGPTTYSEERGHPRLRMRHAPFHISRKEHDAWLICMKDAVNGLEISDDLKAELWEYLEAAAAAMINTAE